MTEYEEFRAAALAAIERLGITDWAIEIVEEPLAGDDEETRARTRFNWHQRAARIVWNTAYRCRPDREVCAPTPREVGLHEVLHILVHCLVQIAAERRDAYAPEVDSEEHGVIRRLIKVMMKDCQ